MKTFVLTRTFVMRFLKRQLHCFVASALVALTGCTGVGVVSDLDVEVSGKRASGELWQATPAQLEIIPVGKISGRVMPSVLFQNEVFEWRFGASAEGFSGYIRSKRVGPVCFLLREGMISSNFQTTPVRLQVYVVRHQIKPVKYAKAEPGKSNAPNMCIFPLAGGAEDKPQLLVIGAELEALFPSGKMFNVNWQNNQPPLTEKGIGNWLKIRMPIEYEGIREEVEFKLTAKDTIGLVYRY